MPTDGPPEESFAVPPPPPPPPPGSTPPGPPPPYPTPPGPPPGPPSQHGDFLLGLFIGAIPLILAMVGLGSVLNFYSNSYNSSYNQIFNMLLIAGGAGFIVGLVLSIILMIIERTRRFGLGMLTALLVSPIIFFISCLAAVTHPFPAGGTST